MKINEKIKYIALGYALGIGSFVLFFVFLVIISLFIPV